MDNTKTNMGLLELLVVDALFMLIFVLFAFISVISPAKNPFALNLPLVFGGVTLPFAGMFARWLTYLRYHETSKIADWLKINPGSSGWLFYDPGVGGYTWMFRLMSVFIAAASAYHLVHYAFG